MSSKNMPMSLSLMGFWLAKSMVSVASTVLPAMDAKRWPSSASDSRQAALSLSILAKYVLTLSAIAGETAWSNPLNV